MEELLVLRARFKAEKSLYEFLKEAWLYIEGGEKPFVGGYHLEAIAEHLEAVAKRDIKNLLINIPPRCGKSSLVSVAFPCWQWIHNPSEQFLFTSYALSLARRDSIRCRRLIQSPWFQQHWGSKFQLEKDQNTQSRFDNDKKGYRIVTSFGASTTGEGGTIIIADDPNSGEDIVSEIQRESKIDYWTGVLSTRLNDKKTSCRVLIQQRLHERDISGFVIDHDENEEWVKLILPMEFEERRRCFTTTLPSTQKKIWTDWRKEEGELLWPEKIDVKALESLKNDLGTEYRIASQLQQRPAPAEGNIIKKHWFKWWKSEEPPQIEFILQSWDTAISDGPEAAYSAVSNWGIFYDENDIGNVILLNTWRGRVGYPVLREMAQRLYFDYRDKGKERNPIYKGIKIDLCLIEAKATGDPLIRDLYKAGIRAQPFNPNEFGRKTSGKEARVSLISHLIEGGLVWLPAQKPAFDTLLPFADEFLEEVATFPNAASRDLVDTMSQALFKLRKLGLLEHPRDYKEPEKYIKPRSRIY